MRGGEEEGIGDDAMLAAFYLVHLSGLFGNAHVFVNDAQTALPGDGDGHAGVGHRVHGGGQYGNVQLDPGRQLHSQTHVLGHHLAALRYQQHIVKRQTFADNFLQHVSLSHPSIFALFYPIM